MSVKLNILLILCLVKSLIPQAFAADLPSAINSSETVDPLQLPIFDVSPIDWNRERTLRLDGNWEFFWQELLVGDEQAKNPGYLAKGGSTWILIKDREGKPLPSFGYGTYRLRIKGLIPRTEGYSILIRHMASASRTEVYPVGAPERSLVHTVGRVGTSRETTVPSRQWTLLRIFPTVDSPDYVVQIQVANFHHHRGGFFVYPPRLGIHGQIERMVTIERAGSLLSLGILLAVGVFSLMMYIRYRADKGSLMLIFLSLCVALRTLAMTDFLAFLFGAEQSWVYELQLRFEYVALAVGSYFFLAFLHCNYSEYSPKIAFKILTVQSLAALLFVLFAPHYLFTEQLSAFQVAVVVHVLWIWRIIIPASLKARPGARLALAGILVCSAGVSWDLLSALKFLPGPFVLQHAVSLFMLIQSEVLAQRASLAHRESRRYAKQLKHEMRSRVMMVSDLAHRTNNPLNYIAGGIRHLKEDIAAQMSELHTLFAESAAHDPEIKALQSHFDERLAQMHATLDTMADGLLRSAHSVAEIRVLSGVDGYALSLTSVAQSMDLALHRLEDYLGRETRDRIVIDSKNLGQLLVASHPTILSLCFELVIKAWLPHSSESLSIALQWEDFPEQNLIRLDMMRTVGQAIDATEEDHELIEHLDYILTPYHAGATISEDFLRVSFRLKKHIQDSVPLSA